VVGVTSFGDENCNISGFDTRVDAEQTFINTYVQMYDPAPATPTPMPPTNPPSNPTPTPPANNPDQTPSNPTNPGGTTPQQPGAGLLEAGQQCTADAQCGSGVCGIGNRGTLVCLAAKNGGNKTLGGCSFGGAESDPGFALALIIGVGMLLRSGLRRRR
jgi:hypothetical protein